MITVVNKKTHKPCKADVYIGRPSPLGNPYPMKTEADRARVIARYTEWLNLMYNYPGPRDTLQMLKHRVLKGMDVHLVCWCAPLPCHGDVVKAMVLEIIDTEAYISRVNDRT